MYKLLFSLLAIYLAIILVLYIVQKRFIFYPTLLDDDYVFSEFENFEEHYYKLKLGVRLHALHFKVPKSRGLVLYFHGNARALDSWGHEAETFRQLGYEVFMPDYRGYGKSKGPITEMGLHNDAMYLYKKMREHYPADKIVLYGRSLGSGVACRLATKVAAKLLVLETPYTSILDMSKLKVSFVPASWLLRFRFRNDKKIKRVQCPVHIFHGTRDELIPYRQAVQLAELYGDPDILTTIEGAGHNDVTSFEKYRKKLNELLD